MDCRSRRGERLAGVARGGGRRIPLVCLRWARHFEGKAWTSAATDAVDLSGTVSLAAAPDGSAWLATGSVNLPGDTWGPHTGIAIAHFDGRSWTVYDSADGLPAPEPTNWATVTAVAASSQTVIAATRDGFYRLSGDRWVRAGPPPASGPAWAQGLLAVSAREAWAPLDDGLWHFRDGSGTRVPVADWKPPLRAFDVARAPDGTLAVATDKGTAILRDGRWTVLGKRGGARGHHRERRRDLGRRATIGRRADDRRLVPLRRTEAGCDNALPAVDPSGWPSQLVVAPDGQPWVLS